LLQMNRDWIWYQAWGRYAWNPNRNPVAEHAYWVSQFSRHYGDCQAGELLLEAYEDSGIAAPELLPWIGITEGNRESFSLGLTMPQLIHPELFGPANTLWTGDAPKGERLATYVSKEVAHQPHEGITPLGMALKVTVSSEAAVRAAEEAGQYVSQDRAEYLRVLNDMRCIHKLMQYYNAKTQAAYLVMLYGDVHNLAFLEEAERRLAQSVNYYKQLVSLTDKSYLAGPSLDTSQRRIPFVGGPGRFNHWRDCLPQFEEELAIFRERLAWLTDSTQKSLPLQPLKQVGFTLRGANGQIFHVDPGARIYTDGKASIAEAMPELYGLNGIRISQQQTSREHSSVAVTLEQPAEVLVGFFFSSSEHHPPADPGSGLWQLQSINAVTVKGNPSLTIFSRELPAGQSMLNFGRGDYVILGFVAPHTKLAPKINFYRSPQDGRPNLDWLFLQ